MSEEKFNEQVKCFFKALRQKRLLIIIDGASKNEKAVFSLVSFTGDKIVGYSAMLAELGFKNYRKEPQLFITYCAGHFRLYILDNIGNRLKDRGVKLPRGFYDQIQN